MSCGRGGKVFASSFPMIYRTNNTIYEAPQCFVEGKRISHLKPVTQKKHYDFGVYGYYAY